MTSLKFVVSSLDIIAANSGRNKQLSELVQTALVALEKNENQLPDPEVLFRPLQLATKSGSVPLATTALDCIGKLISYSYFTVPAREPSDDDPDAGGSKNSSSGSGSGGATQAPLIERAIDTICDCFQGETTPVEIQLQIVKSLLAAVLNDKIVVHGAGLLKAVRQVYNIFLLSRSTANQQVAQGTLTQMVGTVFERVKNRLHMREARANLGRIKNNTSAVTVDPAGSSQVSPPNGNSDNLDSQTSSASENQDLPPEDPAPSSSDAGHADGPTSPGGPKLTLKDLEHRKSFDDSNLGDGPTMVTQLKPPRRAASSASDPSPADNNSNSGSSGTPEESALASLDAEDEVYIRDAYLIFRSFCNLSTKVLPPDHLFDLRGQPMRSKLISLHLIHTLLNNNISVFTSPYCTITNTKSSEPTGFLQAIKYYLCLSITRNGASSVDRVFEVCCDIFWLMLKYMRAPFKKEIEVFMNEIYLALVARKTAPLSQKMYVVGMLNRFCGDPRGLVETYLNYDCDRNVDNIFQTIVEDLSKFATAPVMVTPAHMQQYEEKQAKTRGDSNHPDWQLRGVLPPPLSVAHIVPGHEPEPEIPKDYVLKRVALDSLVETLRSLVNWSQPGRPLVAGGRREGGGATANAQDADKRDNNKRPSSGDEVLRESMDPSASASDSLSRIDTPILPSTPVLDDDPEQLEREKARKTARANAIRAFNQKPKNGVRLLIKEGFVASDRPADIARFLISEERLDKAQIGEYLGEGEDKNIEIMHAFVDTMEFSKKRFVDALRQFLQSFRLPGEAQKIDRFMLKFANRYVMGNPNAFANADTAYVLAYSVILLNTDLHSSKIANRMTREDFIRNNRGINDSSDLPEEYLTSIYDEILHNEIVLTSERRAAAAAGALPAPAQGAGLAAGLGQAFSNVGRDLQREAYVQQSEEISSRSEQLFKNLFRSQRRNAANNHHHPGATGGSGSFIPASSFRHVGAMFDVTWMSFFSALSSQMQKNHNLEVNKLCLEGMKLATQIACLFGLATPKEAFISALRNTANLNNPQEMQAKNVEALKVMLELGQTEGNLLKESWRDILMCISQLDRLQLISGGIDESAVPDVSKARFVQGRAAEERELSRRSTASSTGRRPAPSSQPSQSQSRPRAGTGGGSLGVSAEIALESRSDEVVKSVDRIFTGTANLSGEAIVHFARALTEVSWDEIRVSGSSNDSPRTYSLQKIVEISYYNMTRVRFEWTSIWDVLGEHFNRVACHGNTAIVFFALDSLRQLSVRFMELEELAGFKFQKDFLKPFEHVMANSANVAVKDMVLRCLVQMIQAKGANIRSGWRTMFGVFTVAAREPHESIVSLAYENVMLVYKTRFGVVISQGAFTDLIVCLTEFSKNMRFQKKSLQAMEALKSVVPRMLKTPECPLSRGERGEEEEELEDDPKNLTRTSVEEGFWFPVLFAFHDVLMTGEDLEVRSNALNYFFDTLIKHGGSFPPDFWDILWRQQLYPIFMVLRSRPEMSNVLSHEELSVWLSTTMIQALRNMITLFTHYFDPLAYMLDRFLELLALCICQENDTIARIGSNCLQQLVLQNVAKFTPEHWSKIVGAFCELFERTTAYQLFSATTINSTASLSPPPNGLEFSGALSPTAEVVSVDETSLKINGDEGGENGDAVEDEEKESRQGDDDDGDDALRTPTAAGAAAAAPEPSPQLEEFKPSSQLQQQPVVVTAARRRFFNRIISRCVLQLLMIETVNELFSNETVYARIPSQELLRLMALLKKSFLFARRFNGDKELRMRLWREGFMKQPPNLLKQESGSAATYVAILFRMFGDASPERRGSRADVENALVPLCRDIIAGYAALDEDSQHRNMVAWRPVVVDVLEGYAAFARDAFAAHTKSFYPLVVELLAKELTPDLRAALLLVLRRVGEVGLGIDGMAAGTIDGGISSKTGKGSGHGRRESTLSVATGFNMDNTSDDASSRMLGR